jgi:7,8-dihydropterin-6-yl-methyl-4-(beta-D-ribofuranosyl)aminobenzene 5'-phosphate synthase
MTITSLVDDYSPKRALVGEHGLSFHIETGVTRLLFDTGQSGLVVDNARRMGIDLSSLDAVVLSHGHYDHGGGLAALAELIRRPIPLYAGKGITDPRYSKVGEKLVSIGLEAVAMTIGKAFPACIVESRREIAKGLCVLPKAEGGDGNSALPRFIRISEGTEAVDRFDDELSLVAYDEEGIAVITGCAHRGIVNIARQAMAAFPGRSLKALIGGFHLVEASPEVLADTALALAALDPHEVYCAHCTGLSGYAALCQLLPGKVRWLSCGARIDL